MNRIFPNNLTPQRRHLLKRFEDSVRAKRLSPSDLGLVLVHPRETERDAAFREFGSNIAHFKRDRGWLWDTAISIWVTQLYFKNLSIHDIPLGILPMDVFNTIWEHVERLSQRELDKRFSHLYPGGIPKKEVLHTLDFHYEVPRDASRRPGEGPVCHLVSRLSDEDAALIRAIIIDSEHYALNIPPIALMELVELIEAALSRQLDHKRRLSSEDKLYLQLHLLVALHGTLIEVKEKKYRDLTGVDYGDLQPMAFLSCFEENLSIDIGFFERENGKYIEPAAIYSSGFFGSERFYYPYLISDLPVADYMLESDENIRLCLYNHPVRVIRRAPGSRRHAIVAEERHAGRFKPTSARYARD